ncbi:hypothetical protein F5Y19DRAFT_484228 [Xylariaceae sp. FL1651]|nr:hypothetical protein F5Y19DRAFT_484228 [Xylariaceae sp. FL1651]
MFFATPHPESKEEFLTFLSDDLECNEPTEPWLIRKLIRPTEDMKKEIQQYPMLLAYISDDFVPLRGKLSLKVFREGHITKSLGKVVLGRSQAIMYHNAAEGNATMINGDHLSALRLITMLRTSSEAQRKLDKLCSDTLCLSMMTKKPMDNTGEWIFKLKEFEDWSNEKSEKSRLWISGKPGCGKSYLAKRIVDKLSEQGKMVVSAFLCKPDQTNIDAQRLLSGIIQHALDVEPELYRDQPTAEGSDVKDLLIKAQSLLQAVGPPQMTHPRENNVQGLLAATVRQVLDMALDLVDTLLIPYLEPRVFDGGTGTPGDLEALWVNVMTDESVRHPIIAVIDGFDKMERKCQKAFFDTLAKLSAMSQATHNLRLLLFSTEYKDLDSDLREYEFIRYDIQTKDVNADITMAVNSHLGVVQKIYNYPSELQKQVPKAANGTYLRADLMLGGLKRTRYSKGDLQELLSSPPNSIAALYDHLFGRIWAKEAISRSVKQVLSWVVFRREGLNPAELAIARALGEARDNAHGRDISYEQVCQFLDKNTELWVNRFCGHLVKLEDGCFELVHPSLAEYLTTEHEFLRYAALHWSAHLKLARDLAVPGGGIRETTADRARRLKLEKKRRELDRGRMLFPRLARAGGLFQTLPG